MANIPAFSLSYDFFGAPGLGGSSRLSITPTSAGTVVTDELPGEGPEFRRREVLPAHRGWRGVVDHLIRYSIVAYDTGGSLEGEYPWPYLQLLKGRESIATDMISIAFSGEPVSDVARVLASLDDATLEDLRVRHGSLRSEAFIDEVMRVKHWCDEMRVDFDDVIARGPRFGWNFRMTRKDVVALARVSAAEEKAKRLRNCWSLSPFEPRIATLVLAWRRANPATSSNTQMGVSIRSGILQRFLEAYAREHGTLPNGIQFIKNDTQYGVGDLTVDLDALVPISEGAQS
jgi:hypothetical protein